jgi:hypothetical protein
MFRHVTAWSAACAALVGGIAGCGSTMTVPRREAGYIVGTQGAGSEVVFHGVQVSGAELVAGEELARRDEALAPHATAALFDELAWPAYPAPSLDRARYLYLPRQSNSHLYFGTRPTHGRHHFRSNLYR